MTEEKKDYRQTEIGLIPEDWEVETVGEAFEIKNNLRLPISRNVRKSMQGKYPYYGPTGIQDYIDEYRVEGKHALIGEDGDHFLKWDSMSMTLLVDGKFNVNNHAHIVKGVKNLTEWFYYFFGHRDLTSHLKRQGAGRYKLNKSTLIELPCAVPPLTEQQAIASALSDVDELIRFLDRLIQKKEAIKKGTMQQLLTGQKRLPGFDGEWEVKRLGEITDVQKGDLITKSTAIKGDVPVIAGGKTISYYHNKPNRNSSTITVSASGAYAGYVSFHKDPIFASDCSTIEESDKFDIQFMYFKLLSIQRGIYDLQSGGAQPHVYPNQLEKLELEVPVDIKEQNAIAQILSDMDRELQTLRQKREKYVQVKQGMMQELLTGKVRLVAE